MVDLQDCNGDTETATSTRSTVDEWLKQARELSSLVLVEASMVKVFVGRWMNIKRKLEQLPPRLSELADFPGSLKNSLCVELLQTITTTLQETRQLAFKCGEQHYEGRLQMQSSLDALAMRLELHLHDSELLIKSGLLRESSPTNVSRLRSRASREAMKWNVKDLLARLQIGNLESKQKPLDSLVELMQEGDKNVLLVAGQGGVPTLVHLLDAGLVIIKEKAAAAVCCLSEAESCEQLLVAEGALGPLVRLLECSSPFAKEKAATALQALTITSENARSVAAQGGIPALVEICQNGTPIAQAAAAGTLRNLASIVEIRQTLAEEGAIFAMIGLVTSGTAIAQEHAADGLQNMASSDNQLRCLVAKEGGIQALLMYFDAARTPRAQEIAMGALRNIAASGSNIEDLLNQGFLSRLIAALKSGQCMLQLAAASAVCNVARSMELRRLLGEAGCIPPLVGMLEAKTSAAQEIAAQALFSLILVECNRKEIRKEERCISGMVKLLDSSNDHVTKKFPISVLLCLSGNRRCRKRMVSAGACAHLKKLVAMDVTGSKKLLERLERGRWGIFKV